MPSPSHPCPPDLLQKVVSLAKRRGFVFQSSEIYGGLKSAYDYGPLGTELKRNLMNAWWTAMVQRREDVVGLDSAILMHPRVWEASGHLAGFSDPLVDCHACKERFRADHAPRANPGQPITYTVGGKKGGAQRTGVVPPQGYLCPACGGPELGPERQFNLMFRTAMGPVDAVGQMADFAAQNPGLNAVALRQGLEAIARQSAVYLRPETAQAMFVQFANVQQSMAMKVPFGIAQMGKSFRNEITTEHFIFRSCEFEQMEMEFFVEPGSQREWLEYWRAARLTWWQSFARDPTKFVTRAHTAEELAHYADACYDIEYAYPWGMGELEGIASRTDYDLTKHQAHSGQKLTYFDPQKVDPATGKLGWHYTPYVIEPAAGVTRGVLVYLLDAYCEETVPDPRGEAAVRTVLRLHPQLAPIKVALLPLVKKDGLPEAARRLLESLVKLGIIAQCDINHAIGRRYRRHDEIGTPICVTLDGQTKTDATVTVRDRDTMQQIRVGIDALPALLQKRLEGRQPA